MAKVNLKTKLDYDIKINLELSLEEAKALNIITKYGSKSFLEGYYKQLGKSYLQPHEKGVVSLFETIKLNLPARLKQADAIIDTVNKLKE